MFRHPMAGNEKYSLRFGKKVYAITVCSVLFLVVGLWQTIPSQKIQNKAHSSSHRADDSKYPVPSVLLYDSDKELYKQIFSAQKSAEWALADESISKLSNKILLGDVLAERYLHRHYDTSSSEIIFWLKNYSDHVQVQDMLELAGNKFPNVFSNLPKIEKQQRLQGYGDGSSEDIRFDDNPQAKKLWQYGLEAWRTGKKSESAKFFSTLADKQKGLSDWQDSAANFWAYRSYLAIGDKVKANYYISQAASNPRVFYGILARKQLDKPLELDTKPIEPIVGEVRRFLEKSKIQRIIALVQSGLNERAEAQIRLLFPMSDKQEKWLLLSLANRLELASVQISMAKQLESNDNQLDMLKYPIPQWKPAGGFNIEPTLLYALMRQESGFHVTAISSGGALGLMQLMPQTAKRMQTSYTATNSITENVSEPVLNLTLGEHYVEHLLNNNMINGNLFYMLTAYNAGPGRLKEWQDNIDYNDDPLLFVESIPYSETRHYVVQVMTNYWIYSELAGTPSESVHSILRGNWPNYLPNTAPVADAGRRDRNG